MGGTTLSERDRPAGPPAGDATAAPEPAVPAPRARPPAPPGPRARAAFPVLLLALVAAALGQTGPAAALPEIARALPGLTAPSWVMAACLLGTAAGLPLHGKLGDVLGRKAAFLVALLVFTAASGLEVLTVSSGLAGWTPSPAGLIAARALQGLGAGGVLIGVPALLGAAAPPAVRGRRTAAAGAVYAVAALTGPLAGACCADHGLGRWSPALGAPLGATALLAAALAVRIPRSATRPRPDLAGALLLTGGATCLALLASWGGTRYPWGSPVILGLGAGGLAAAALLPFTARFTTAPLLPPRLLRDTLFGRTGLVGAVLGLALYGAARHLPAFPAATGAPTATASALLMLPLPGALLAAAYATTRLVRRTRHHTGLPLLGCAVALVGIWLPGHLPAAASGPARALCSGVLGLGLGLVLPALVLTARSAVPIPGPAGTTACLRRLGGTTAAALAAALLAERLAARLPFPDPLAAHLARALPAALREGCAAFLQAAVPGSARYLAPALALGFLLALSRKENPLVSHAPQPPQTPHPPYGDPADPAVPPARSAADTALNGPAPGGGHHAPYPAPLAPSLAGVPVCGTVQHHDGSIVPRAALTLIDIGGRQIGRGATGEDGRYALSTPGAGSYVLIAAAGGHQPQAVTVTVGERPVELDVVLGGAGRLAGTVTTADGTPVRDAMVTLTDVRGEVVATTRSGREGGYVIGDLVAGEYTLASSAPAFRPAALPVTVQASRETRQDIELAGGAVLRGTVRAGGGRPVEDARVTLLDAAGNVVDTATTGPDGLFRFVDLSSGEYTVVAAGYPPTATVLRVAGGGRTERDLQLGYED
ncbi:MFS transporter [Streptomyces sp. NRRL F-4489]|uniref:MFS transporter n=1 Tax=Streptomyces sp. NRRL F-4489 TaxID=1609095 RepID=UPI000747AE03|nr:MFS transporter [Streptomyces sp. NRRL F-4489]KUL51507.1 MFS transporter [Streptomyces sp. NRRL F-4489]